MCWFPDKVPAGIMQRGSRDTFVDIVRMESRVEGYVTQMMMITLSCA